MKKMSLLSYFVILALIFVSVKCGQIMPTNGASEFDKCGMTAMQTKFDILPGRGWDNLQNKEMGRILRLNFSRCLFSQDNLYLMPNDVSITPIKMSKVDVYSELFTHFSNYTSTTSQTINVNAHLGYGIFSASGSYSHEKQTVKNDQMLTKSSISRVQLRYKVFQSIFEPDSPLEPVFRSRIMDIASVIVEGKDTLYPQYLADLVIRDFGTHVIRTIDAGAILSKIDALDSKYVKKYESETDSNTISASASASFAGLFSVGMSASYKSRTTKEQLDSYTQACVKSHVETYGGTLFRANFSLNDWEESVMRNLVPIDRSGDPIYYVLTARSLPELDDRTINEIYKLLKSAVHRYYEANIIRGCLNVLDPNFNPDANVDSGDCKSPLANFTLGGVYQVCNGPSDQCSAVNQVNPLTGGNSCPTGFYSVILINNVPNRCEQHCSGWWLWRHCHTDCSSYSTYWCAPLQSNTPNHNGYQFGGMISSYGGVGKCPQGFISLKLGLAAHVCVSNDPDPNNPNAIVFGGFYSCNVGNPLAQLKVKDGKLRGSQPMLELTYWPHNCANGYIAHVLSIERGCQMSYCTKTNTVSLGSSPPLHRPPFIDTTYNPNTTKPLVFSTQNGDLMLKDNQGIWQLKEIRNSHHKLVIGTVLGSIAVALVVSFIVFVVQRRWYLRKIKENKSCLVNNDETSNYGAFDNQNVASLNDLEVQA